MTSLPVRRSNIATPATVSAIVLAPVINTVPYALAGALSVTTSPAVTPANNMYISAFSATLSTAGTATSTIELLVNGSSVASVSLQSGQTYGVADVNPMVLVNARTDKYSVSVTAAGTGASGLGGEIEYLFSTAPAA
jgi:hypothetical protein